jgi:hypothetical protein
MALGSQTLLHLWLNLGVPLFLRLLFLAGAKYCQSNNQRNRKSSLHVMLRQ